MLNEGLVSDMSESQIFFIGGRQLDFALKKVMLCRSTVSDLKLGSFGSSRSTVLKLMRFLELGPWRSYLAEWVKDSF